MGAVFSIFIGFNLLRPLLRLRAKNEYKAKIFFFRFIIGINIVFFPLHFAGLSGIPRRNSTMTPTG